MSRYHLIGSIIVIVFALAGCGVIYDFQVGWDSAKYTAHIMKLRMGMSREDVLATMGQPEKREAHGRLEFLIYRTDNSHTEKMDFTPVALVDGKVTGWGRNFYGNAAPGGLLRIGGKRPCCSRSFR
jgi:hypothetical protein